MHLPAKPAKPSAKPTPAPVAKKNEAAESSREFEDRLAKIEQAAGARHESAALDALRKRAAGKTTAGMPGATGTEAGSDYVSYIQSRLTDAFRSTIAFQSKNPQVAVRITIGRNGRIVRMRTEQSTGDKVFEDAVARAIAKAEQSFPPPPNREELDALDARMGELSYQRNVVEKRFFPGFFTVLARRVTPDPASLLSSAASSGPGGIANGDAAAHGGDPRR